MRDVFKFYYACVKHAFEGWFKRIEGWTSSLALLIAVALLFFDLPTKIEQSVQKIPAGFFLLVFLVLIFYRLMLAPYELFRDERAKSEASELLRLPSLEITLPDPPVIQSIHLRGHTSETFGGTRQTIINGLEMDVVALTCANKGETKAVGCQARLMSMTKVLKHGEEALRVVTPIALPWEKENPEDYLKVDLVPNETRRIWIGGVRSQGHIWLFREIKSLPLEYQQLLGAAGTYRLLIQLDGDNIAAQQIEIEITASEGSKPESGIQRGQAEVFVIAQGAPTISR